MKIAISAHPLAQPMLDLMVAPGPRSKFRWPATSATCITSMAMIHTHAPAGMKARCSAGVCGVWTSHLKASHITSSQPSTGAAA